MSQGVSFSHIKRELKQKPRKKTLRNRLSMFVSLAWFVLFVRMSPMRMTYRLNNHYVVACLFVSETGMICMHVKNAQDE